jgi:hypothetical protein
MSDSIDRSAALKVIAESGLDDWEINHQSGMFQHREYAFGGTIINRDVLSDDDLLLDEIKTSTSRAVNAACEN